MFANQTTPPFSPQQIHILKYYYKIPRHLVRKVIRFAVLIPQKNLSYNLRKNRTYNIISHIHLYPYNINFLML